jgi:hypothetical protein
MKVLDIVSGKTCSIRLRSSWVIPARNLGIREDTGVAAEIRNRIPVAVGSKVRAFHPRKNSFTKGEMFHLWDKDNETFWPSVRL